jgi:2-C-methyl-D-erythritol 2,4-cyclodiphosphate synthase
MLRTGIGFDIHRFAAGRRLVLGGVAIPHPVGLEGHSDADVLCHALADALLGAVADGDIGQHFPDTDPKWKGADSRVFVEKAVAIVTEAKLVVGNIDCTVFLERPKLGPLKKAIEKNIASLLGTSEKNVAVKAKTLERLGEIGRGKAVAAQVVVLLDRSR